MGTLLQPCETNETEIETIADDEIDSLVNLPGSLSTLGHVELPIVKGEITSKVAGVGVFSSFTDVHQKESIFQKL